MRKYETLLDAKVGERNAAHQYILDLWPQMVAALRPWLGKKILNQGAVKSERFRKTLPENPNTPELSFWISSNEYGLRLEVKTCGVYRDRRGEHGIAYYAESSWGIAEIRDGVLVSINENPPTNLRTNYTVAEVLSARAELKTAQMALNTAQSKLGYFGEHDNF